MSSDKENGDALPAYSPVEEYFQIPKSYTLESQLVMVIIQNFVFNINEESKVWSMDAKAIEDQLTTLLKEKLKLNFTLIQVERSETHKNISGKVAYDNGKPMLFTLRMNEPFKTETNEDKISNN